MPVRVNASHPQLRQLHIRIRKVPKECLLVLSVLLEAGKREREEQCVTDLMLWVRFLLTHMHLHVQNAACLTFMMGSSAGLSGITLSEGKPIMAAILFSVFSHGFFRSSL